MNTKGSTRSRHRKSPCKYHITPSKNSLSYHLPLTRKLRTGKIAEILTTYFLKMRGWTILSRNYQTQTGEIDIIASKSHVAFKGSTTIAFVEVKSRSNPDALPPELNVTISKQKKIVSTAKYWILKNGHPKFIYRFDVAAICIPPNQMPHIKYIDSAFFPHQEFGW